MSTQGLIFTNAIPLPLEAVPVVGFSSFGQWLMEKTRATFRVCAFFALPGAGGARLFAVLACDKEEHLAVLATDVGMSYPSLTLAVPALHLFEREIHERHSILPEGHPWLKPVRFEGKDARVGVTDFFRIDGDEVHEVGVGPIHAGIIECGHFRFQCQGEVVMHLEISLGYHHRGVEPACLGKPGVRALALMETVAGDTSIGHAWAYCSNLESLAGLDAPPRAKAIRGIALELERLANHTGDMGALAGDTGYLPTASFCGRLRGDYLNMTAMMCGNRFGRNLLCPGGVRQDLGAEDIAELQRRLRSTLRDTLGATALIWETDSVTGRMLGRGILSKQAALELGLVGPAARACGIKRDARRNHPLPGLPYPIMALQTGREGDVYARARVREKEIRKSAEFVKRMLDELPKGDTLAPGGEGGSAWRGGRLALKPSTLVVSLVEGWRGEICHVAMTDAKGEISFYKVVDPSFHNWIGLALAMRMQQISDFPLCNKSFNLSYCGHDL